MKENHNARVYEEKEPRISADTDLDIPRSCVENNQNQLASRLVNSDQWQFQKLKERPP